MRRLGSECGLIEKLIIVFHGGELSERLMKLVIVELMLVALKFEIERADIQVRRRLYLFAMVLGHSHYLWGRFCRDQKLPTVLAMHMAGFEAFSGAPRQVLYDRMKTAVTGEDRNGCVIYNLSCSIHCRTAGTRCRRHAHVQC